jgi:hypothetical protein
MTELISPECFSIPPVATVRATFTAHGDRLSRPLPSFPLCRHWRGFPSLNIRHIRTLRHLIGCGPSPCGRLSRPRTTMAALTPLKDIGGFLGLLPTLYFRSPLHSLGDLPCSHGWTQTRARRWRLLADLSPHIAAPLWMRGNSGSSASLFHSQTRIGCVEAGNEPIIHYPMRLGGLGRFKR